MWPNFHVPKFRSFQSLAAMWHVHCVCTENYHQLMDILSRMKISCLERRKEEAKKKYRTHKKQYVDKSLGRPMEKLSVSR